MKKQFAKLILVIIFSIFLCFNAYPQDNWNVNKIGSLYHFWDDVRDMAIIGDYAYLATRGSGMSVVDISDPNNLVEISYFDTPSWCEALDVDGNYAYLKIEAYPSSVLIVDITDPLNIEEVGSYEIMQNIYDVFINGDYLYVSTSVSYNTCYVKILDVSNPETPTEIGLIESDYPVMDIAFRDNYAYFANEDIGLSIYNITDPANPFGIGNFDTPGSAREIELHNDFAFIADYEGGLWAIDISDPANPSYGGFVDPEGSVTNLTISANTAFVLTSRNNNKLIAYDITYPAAMSELGYYQFQQSQYDNRLSAVGNVLYCAERYDGLRNFNITDPAYIQEITILDNCDIVKSVLYFENYLAVSCLSNGLQIYDAANPANLVEIASLDTICVYSIYEYLNEYLYCYAGSDGLIALDVSDPSSPFIAGQYIGVYFDDVCFSNGYAYFDGVGYQLYVLDYTDVSDPVLTDSIDFEYGVYDIVVSNNHAYITTYEGLKIVDVSDPYNISLAGELTYVSGYPGAEYAQGNTLYVTVNDGISPTPYTLYVYDISDPLQPQQLGNQSVISVGDMLVSGNYLYSIGSGGLMTMYNIADPENIHEVGNCIINDNIYSISVAPPYLFMSESIQLGIYDCSEALPVTETMITDIPTKFHLAPLYPNPFNASAEIRYSLAEAGEVNLSVFDIQGREVIVLEKDYQQPGNHSFVWNAEKISSGIYFVRLAQNGNTKIQKAVLVK